MNDERIVQTILDLLAHRRPRATVCPSEVERGLFPDDEAAWRALMPQVRAVALALAAQRRIRITRGGGEVSAPDNDRGPIRLARVAD